MEGVSIDLSYRAVASQVFSPLQRLTSVFGMGTGGPTALIKYAGGIFLAKRCAVRYRNALAFGSASEKYAKRIVPDDPPEKANDLDDYLDCSVFFDIFCYNVELYYKLCYN